VGLLYRPLHRRALPLQVPAAQAGNWDLYNAIRSNGDELYAGRTQATTTCAPSATRPTHRTSSSSPSASKHRPADAGDAVLRELPAHYYDVQGIEISDAFASIARTINQLRLIQ
jgi:hypothetical protein